MSHVVLLGCCWQLCSAAGFFYQVPKFHSKWLLHLWRKLRWSLRPHPQPARGYRTGPDQLQGESVCFVAAARSAALCQYRFHNTVWWWKLWPSEELSQVYFQLDKSVLFEQCLVFRASQWETESAALLSMTNLWSTLVTTTASSETSKWHIVEEACYFFTRRNTIQILKPCFCAWCLILDKMAVIRTWEVSEEMKCGSLLSLWLLTVDF